MHFHFLLQSSQKFSCLPSSLVIDKKCISIFLSSSVITKIFLSSFVVGDGQKMHFHFLLHSSQKISRLPSSLVMDKKCISISFFMKIFPSSIVVGDGQKMHFHFLLQVLAKIFEKRFMEKMTSFFLMIKYRKIKTALVFSPAEKKFSGIHSVKKNLKHIFFFFFLNFC